jgi:CcmD family protein
MPDERLPYLFAVYMVTWLVFFLYSFFLTRRQHEMEREIRSLRSTLQRQAKDGQTENTE